LYNDWEKEDGPAKLFGIPEYYSSTDAQQTESSAAQQPAQDIQFYPFATKKQMKKDNENI